MIGHFYSITHFNFSPNSKYIITTSPDQTAKVWDIQNGEIYDIRGVKVLSLDNSNSTDILLDKGVYILKVKTASGEFITKKLIIQ